MNIISQYDSQIFSQYYLNIQQPLEFRIKHHNNITMGNKTSKEILIGTLNFSAICLSPFEYHDCTVEKDFLSSKFQQIVAKYKTDQKFVWDVGKIDQRLQKERYTPIYNQTAGVENNHLVTKEQFLQLWNTSFQNNKHLIDPKGKSLPSQKQIEEARLFDWIAYETFLNVVYNQNLKAKFDVQTVKDHDPKTYLQFLKVWHSKSYLNNEIKMRRVCDLLKNHSLDVLCLQQAEVREGMDWVMAIGQKYQFVSRPDSTSIVIYRKQKFPDCRDKKFEKLNQENLNFNNDTVICKVGKYLMVSAHLSSKKQKYQIQAPVLFQQLQKVKRKDRNIDILLGVDCNHFMDPKKYSHFNICPQVQTESTTIKKRTAIQLQTKKTNEIVMDTKDQIVTNLYIMESHVTMIDGKSISNKTYLPCNEHPFDHFLVWARVQTYDRKQINNK